MKTRNAFIPLAIAAFVAVATTAGAAEQATNGLQADVYVNGKPISANHVLLMGAGLDPDNNTRDANDADRQAAARAELVTQELLAQEAVRKGLDRDPVVADQLAFQNRVILSRAYLEKYFSENPVTDATLKTAYEWKRANGKLLEYKTRHILVTSADQALAVIGKLDKGEDFAALAQRYSQDPGGQSSGGDLGWFQPENFVDHHFTDALQALAKGGYTRQPVRTRFGWHVIKLEEAPRAARNAPPFENLTDAAREAQRQKAAQIKIESLTADLAKTAKLTGPGAATTVARKGK